MAMKKVIAAMLAGTMVLSVFSILPSAGISVYAEDLPVAEAGETLYSITYDLNGGSGTVPTAEPAAAGSTITINSKIMKNTGYIFAGWFDGEKLYKWGTEYVMPDHDVVFTAQWKMKLSLSYDLGDVTDDYGAIEPTTGLLAGDTVKLLNLGLTKEGYSQRGWYCGDTFYAGGSEFTMPDENVTFTIAWSKYYNLIYTPGKVDGLLSDSDMVYPRLEGLNITIFGKSTFARTGYTITNWKNLATGEIVNFNQSVMMPASDITFEAIWKADDYNVIFNPNGGTGSKIYESYTYDTEITLPECTFTPPAGYEFAFWSFNDKLYKSGDSFKVHVDTPNAPITLKAIWKEIGAARKQGDVNDDEVVTGADIIPMMNHFLGVKKLEGDDLKYADVTDDGKFDLRDLSTFKQYLCGDTVPGPLGNAK